MRIHTSLNTASLYRAADLANVTFGKSLAEHGSRTHVRAFEVQLSGNGITGGQWGNSGKDGAAPYKAATWDEWGIFLGAVFRWDESAKATYYDDAADFHYQTGDRFLTLKVADQHLRHKWGWRKSITGESFDYCDCGAERRRGHLSEYLAREGGNVFATNGN